MELECSVCNLGLCLTRSLVHMENYFQRCQSNLSASWRVFPASSFDSCLNKFPFSVFLLINVLASPVLKLLGWAGQKYKLRQKHDNFAPYTSWHEWAILCGKRTSDWQYESILSYLYLPKMEEKKPELIQYPFQLWAFEVKKICSIIIIFRLKLTWYLDKRSTNWSY